MPITNFLKSKINSWLGNNKDKQIRHDDYSEFEKNSLHDPRFNADYDPLVGEKYATVELGNFLSLYTSHPWVYVCAAAISSAAAFVPFQIRIDGIEQDADEHAPYLRSPNPFHTWFDLVEITFLHLELAGNSYWEIVKDEKTGAVLAIFPLRPDRMKIVPDKVKKIASYNFNVGHGKFVDYKPDEIVHIKYNDAKGEFYGVPPVAAAKNDITIDFNATAWNKNFFIAGAEPGGVLQTDKSLTEQAYQRLRQTWYKRHRGVDKSHEIAILEEGLKFQQVTSKHIDMQFLEMKKWTRDTILSVMRCPHVIVGLSERLSTGTERDQKKVFWYDNVIPKLSKLQHVINLYLMPKGVEFVFITKAIDSIIEDDAVKTTIVQSNVAHGIMTINECREKYYGKDPVGWGDTWWRPIGLVDVQNPVPVVMPGGTNTDAESVTSGAKAGLNSPSQVPQVNVKPGKQPPQQNLYPTVQPKQTPARSIKPRPPIPATQKTSGPQIKTPPNDTSGSTDWLENNYENEGFGKGLEFEKIEVKEPNWDNPQAVNQYNELMLYKSIAGPDDRKMRKLFKNFFEEQGIRVKHKVNAGWPIRKDDFNPDDEPSVNAGRDAILLSFLFDLRAENDLLETAFVPMAENMMKKYGGMLMSQLNADLAFNLQESAVVSFLKVHAAENVSFINSTTRELLKTQLVEAYENNEGIKDILTRVDKVFQGDVSVWRANRIAKTELGVLVNNGRYQAAAQSGVVKRKRWVSALLPTTRDRAGGENHVEMNDIVIDFNQPFEAPRRKGGIDKMMHPGDANAHPENLVNCFCYASYSAGTPEFDDINLGKKLEKKDAEKEIEKKEEPKQVFHITVNSAAPVINTEIAMPEQKVPIVNMPKADPIVVNVAVEKQDAPIINIPKADAAIVNVTVEKPEPTVVNVNVEKQEQPKVIVHVNPTPVTVDVKKADPIIVNVAAPTVNVEAPNITIEPNLTIPIVEEVTTVSRDEKGNIIGSTKIVTPKK